MACDALLVANDNILEVTELKDPATGSFINNATVTAVLVDSAGAQVAGDTWPKTLTYVSASNGTYRATLEQTLAIISGRTYTAQITALGNGFTGFWEHPFKARKRTD